MNGCSFNMLICPKLLGRYRKFTFDIQHGRLAVLVSVNWQVNDLDLDTTAASSALQCGRSNQSQPFVRI